MTAAPATQFALVNGLRLAYAEHPGRPGADAIICLPHLSGHKGAFGCLAKTLAPDYRVIAVDLRGRGDSDKPPAGYGFAYHARDIIGLADKLGLERFSLIGHSFGATAATYLASNHPDRVSALVLLDGGADPKAETLRAMYPAVRRLDLIYDSLEAYLVEMRAVPYHRPWSSALERYFNEDVEFRPDGAVTPKASAQAIEHDLDLHFGYSMCLHFPAVRCPVLFVRPLIGLRGDRGHVFSEAEAQAITSHIPNCRRVDVDGVNHYTMLLQEDSPIDAHVRIFLDRD